MDKKRRTGRQNSDSGAIEGQSGKFFAYSGAVLVMSVVVMIIAKTQKRPSLADTATIQHLIDHGYAPQSFGTVERPGSLARVSWDPKEPLLPWLASLRVPVVFNATEVDNWPARQKWDMEYLRDKLEDTVSVDWNKK